jgi:hypothetical protein
MKIAKTLKWTAVLLVAVAVGWSVMIAVVPEDKMLGFHWKR